MAKKRKPVEDAQDPDDAWLARHLDEVERDWMKRERFDWGDVGRVLAIDLKRILRSIGDPHETDADRERIRVSWDRAYRFAWRMGHHCLRRGWDVDRALFDELAADLDTQLPGHEGRFNPVLMTRALITIGRLGLKHIIETAKGEMEFVTCTRAEAMRASEVHGKETWARFMRGKNREERLEYRTNDRGEFQVRYIDPEDHERFLANLQEHRRLPSRRPVGNQ